MLGKSTIYFFHFTSIVLFFHFFRAREALRQCLPDQLRDATFGNALKDDQSTQHWLTQLLHNLDNMQPAI